jgi:hypothetical protein
MSKSQVTKTSIPVISSATMAAQKTSLSSAVLGLKFMRRKENDDSSSKSGAATSSSSSSNVGVGATATASAATIATADKKSGSHSRSNSAVSGAVGISSSSSSSSSSRSTGKRSREEACTLTLTLDGSIINSITYSRPDALPFPGRKSFGGFNKVVENQYQQHLDEVRWNGGDKKRSKLAGREPEVEFRQVFRDIILYILLNFYDIYIVIYYFSYSF